MNINDFASQLLELAREEREETSTVTIPAGTYWLGELCAFDDKYPDPIWLAGFGGDGGWSIELADGSVEYYTTYGSVALYPVTDEDLENNDLEGLTLGQLVTFEQDVEAEYVHLAENRIEGISLEIPGFGKVNLGEQPTDLQGLFDHIVDNMELAY